MSDSGEKTEEPTSKKLADAREKGQIANSKEVTSAMIMGIVSVMFYFGFDYLLNKLIYLIVLPTRFYDMGAEDALVGMAKIMFDEFIQIVIPMVFIAAIAGFVANFIQVGVVFSLEPLKPSYEKIDPVKGFKRIFSIKNVIEFLKSLIKVVIIAIVCWFVIRANLNDMLKIPVCHEACIPQVLAHMMFQLVGITVVAFIVIAAADVMFQNYNHKKDLRMTKDEVKREYKDSEGNPEIKGRRRQLHREILNGEGVSDAVKKSSVVVTNPIELAVGLRYVSEEKKLPTVTVKGEQFLAQMIKEAAEEHDIPMMENVGLAQMLYSEVDEWHPIPRHMMEPIAEVIRWVNGLRMEQGEAPL